MEAAGLALGGVALAGLFSTCIDVLEHLETGRNWARDVHITLTKLSLIRQRLHYWGTCVSIHPPQSERQPLPNASTEERWLIAHSLLGIHRLLDATSHLCAKHGCGRDSYWRIRHGNEHGVHGDEFTGTEASLHSLDDPGNCLPEKTNTGKSPLGLRALGLRVAWVISDKKRFDALISELEFLVSNLERLGQTTKMAPSRESSSEPEVVERHIKPAKPTLVDRRKTANAPSKAAQSPKFHNFFQEETRELALVPFEKGSQKEEHNYSEHDQKSAQKNTESRSHAKKGEGNNRPNIHSNVSRDDSRQVNTSSSKGPNIFKNQSSGNSDQINGEVGDEVMKAMFPPRPKPKAAKRRTKEG